MELHDDVDDAQSNTVSSHSSFKVTHPTWDSSKRDKWPTFAADFCAYVEFHGGRELVDLLNPDQHSHLELIPSLLGSHTPQQDGGRAPVPTATAVSASVSLDGLSPNLLDLDRKLYCILQLSVTGEGHDLILHVPQRSFVKAFFILQNTFGAANCLRKTELIAKLFDLKFNGNVSNFRQDSLSLLRSIYEAKIGLTDIIVVNLLRAFIGDEYNGMKLHTTQHINEGKTINIYDFVQTLCTSVEMVRQGKTSVNRVEEGCTRCGSSTHTRKKCYAKNHKDGHRLEDPAPARKPNHNKNRTKDNSKEGNKTKMRLEDILGSKEKNVDFDTFKAAVIKANCFATSYRMVNETDDSHLRVQGYPVNHTKISEGLSQQTDQSETKRVRRLKVLDSGSAISLDTDIEVSNHGQAEITGFDGSQSKRSQGSGILELCVRDEAGDKKQISLPKAHRVEGLPEGIISLHQLIYEMGYTFHTSPNEAKITSSDGTVFPVYVKDGVYYLEDVDNYECNYVKSNQSRILWQQLHSRLGHPSHQVMIDTLRNTYGISMATIPPKSHQAV